MGRPSKRGELLDEGVKAFHRRGYAAVSVESITEAAGVPKGTLFNHFGSKEGFAVAALLRYFERWNESVAPVVGNPTIGAAHKLQIMVSEITDKAQESSFSFGCMVGNLAAELSNQHEEIRATSSAIFHRWSQPFEAVIAEGQISGELRSTIPAPQAARFVINCLQGALLRCKVDRDSLALDDFQDIVFGLLVEQRICAAS